MSHLCPGPGEVHNGAEVDDDMLACSRHWYQVSAQTRNRVWREYRTEPQSSRHMQACLDAIAEMTPLAPPRAARR